MSSAAFGCTVLLLCGPWGCAAFEEPPQGCEKPDGRFAAHYVELGGDCGPLDDPLSITLEAIGSQISPIERRVDRNITTEPVLRGCNLRVVQTVTDSNGAILQQVEIETTVDGTRIETGDAVLTRFAAGEPVCSGEYAVSLTPL